MSRLFCTFVVEKKTSSTKKPVVMIEKFIQYQKQVRGLSPRTCQEYEKELRAFATWAKAEGLKWSTITKQDVDRHTSMLTERGLKPATVKKRVAAIRGIYNYFVHEGLLNTNPARFCSTPKLAERLPDRADVAQLDAYLSTWPSTGDEEGMHLAVAIMLETGVRAGELLSIKAEDIDPAAHTITVIGKGNKERIVYYGARTAFALQAYNHASRGPIFAGWTDAKLRWEMYREVGPYAPRCHPHMLRHTFASVMINRGMDVKTLSTIMGHQHMETTEIYAKLNTTQIGARYNQFKF